MIGRLSRVEDNRDRAAAPDRSPNVAIDNRLGAKTPARRMARRLLLRLSGRLLC